MIIPRDDIHRFDALKIVVLVVLIAIAGFFIQKNFSPRLFQTATVYPWGNTTTGTSFSLAITDAANPPVEHNLLGANAMTIFDDFDDPNDPQFVSFLDGLGLTNYRFPGAEANLYHYDAPVPAVFQTPACTKNSGGSGDTAYDVSNAALNNGYGHWMCQVYAFNSSQYDEDVNKGTYARQSTIGHNYMSDFKTIAARVNASHAYTVNIGQGTVQEALDAIAMMQAGGITITNVELGEEMYFSVGRQFPFVCADGTNTCSGQHSFSVNDYITLAKPFADAIKSAYPNIIISVDVPAYSKTVVANNHNNLNWIAALAAARNLPSSDPGHLPITGVSVHYYPDNADAISRTANDCFSMGSLDSIIDCSKNAHARNANELLFDTADYYRTTFGSDIKVLFTEWNTTLSSGTTDTNSGSFANTLLQAIYIGAVLNNFNTYNIEHPGAIPVSDLHSISAYIYGPISPKGAGETITDTVGDWDEDTGEVVNTNSFNAANKEPVRRASYWPMYLMSQVFQNDMHLVDTALSVPTSVTGDNSASPLFGTYTYTKGDGTYNVYAYNFSGVPVSLSALSLNEQSVPSNTPITFNEITGNNLYASRGKTNLTQGYPEAVETAQVYFGIDTTVSDLVIPGYSFGYFTLKQSDIGSGSGGDTTPPSTPTNLSVQSTTSSSVTLSWDPSTDDSGIISNYNVYQLVDGPGAAGTPACSDGIDNDSDGLTDYPNDTGCSNANDTDEFNPPITAACADGIDNDGDTLIDLADPGCTNASDTDETNSIGGGADTTPPSISITSPQAGTTMGGTITLSADATDNVGVTSVQFRVDNTNIGRAVTAPPFSVSWDSTTVTNGSHIVRALVSDAAGNITTASTVNVTISNTVSPSRLHN